MAVHKATLIALLLVAVFAPASMAANPGLESVSVRIDGCSGTVIARGRVWAYGISAAHCIDEDGPVLVRFMNGSKCKATWESIDTEVDLALFKFSAKYLTRVASLSKPSDVIEGFGLNGYKKLKYSDSGPIYDKSSKSRYIRTEYIVESGKIAALIMHSDLNSEVDYYKNTMYGVAFNINDDLSVSYGYHESEQGFVNPNDTENVTADVSSVQVAYSMGGASLKIAETSVDNGTYVSTTANDKDGTTVALSLAF